MTMADIVATLYDRLESYEEIARRYRSLEEALREEKHRSDRLEQELNWICEVGFQLRGYVKQRFDRLFSTFQDVRQLSEERAKILSKQEDRLARIRDLEKENKRLETSLSEAAASDPDKVRRDLATARASLGKEYRTEINFLNQKLKSRIAQLESIRALRDADAKKHHSAAVCDQQRIADLETQITSFSTLRDQHREDVNGQKRKLERLRSVMADFHSENARLQRLAKDRGHDGDVAIADRDLAVADRDKLWAHLAQLDSVVPFAVSSTPGSSDNTRPRSGSRSSLPSKRCRVSGAFSPMNPAKVSTRSVRSKTSSGST